jgi:hypothetical protein
MNGCATLTKPGAPFYGMGQKDKLATASMLQKQGKTSESKNLLSEICAEPAVPGVTDEALFRLAILRLGSEFEADNIEKCKKELDRLAQDFPSSSWTQLALPLRNFLASSGKALKQGKKLSEQNKSLSKENRELKDNSLSMAKELRNVKEINASLSKENSGLRQRVEKLKSIDLDMEKGNKHLGRPRVR